MSAETAGLEVVKNLTRAFNKSRGESNKIIVDVIQVMMRNPEKYKALIDLFANVDPNNVEISEAYQTIYNSFYEVYKKAHEAHGVPVQSLDRVKHVISGLVLHAHQTFNK